MMSRFPYRLGLLGMLCSGCLIESCAQVGTSPPTAGEARREGTPAGAEDLRAREIDLLKRRLAAAQQQLDSEKIGRLVYQTQSEVAAIRGFQTDGPVTFEPLTKETLHRILSETFDRQFPGPALELYVWVNQLFGALPEGIDMLGYLKDLTTEQVAGLYDPLSRVLYVRTDFKLESPLGRMILAHEICHALQDQNHLLAEMGVDSAENGDLSTAVLSIAEGDATLLMSEYLTKYGNPLGLFADLPKMMMMDQQKLNSAPPAIQQSMLFPYFEGMRFFNELGGRTRQNPKRAAAPLGDSAWRDEVFDDPPETTEQILHPEKYLAREMPARIELPATAREQLATSATNVLGEFGTALMLETYVGKSRAAEAAAGWHGDRLLLGDTAGGERRLLWLSRWDTAEDARQYVEALKDALTTRYAGALNWSDRGGGAFEGRTREAHLRIAPDGENGVQFAGEFRPVENPE